MKRHSLQLGRFALTSVALAALLVHAPTAWSLGLGRLSVQSSLGETLKAEIDVTSVSPDEASTLKVRVAPPEAYRSAGVDYNAVLPGTQVVLQRRGDRQVLVLNSERSVQEPFVDVILELTWSTGRLVREYTLLFDPPTTTARVPAPSGVTTPPALTPTPLPSSPPASPSPSPSATAPVPEAPAPRPSRPATRPTAQAPAPAPAALERSPGDTEYRVKPGDTLSRIAGQNLSSGVSLEQMLVALHKANSAAFIDNNMNRLKAGVVLNVPAAETATAVPVAEAREIIRAQSTDFRAYAERLASAAPTTPTNAPGKKASGQVKAEVVERRPAATPDKLTLTNGGAANRAAAASTPEAQISREKQLQATNERVKELTANVEKLKKVQADASAVSAAPAATPPAPVVAPVVPAVPVPVAPPPAAPVPPPPPPPAPPPPPPPPPPAPMPAPTPAPAPVPAPSPDASAVVAPVAPVTEAASAAVPPPPEPASAPAQAASGASPGTMSSLFGDNSLALVIGGGLIALLAGFGIYRLSRRSRKDSGETSFLESRLQPDSFFGASGGQRIDTRNETGASSSMSYSLSQLDAIGDVDPVAEADVYLAYGRDLQAEEILKEAIRGNPDRLAIRTKLLEVYAKRRDVKGFEQLATQLFTLTQGEGEDWARAQELGAQIDPDNPLYRPGGLPGSAAAPSFSAAQAEPGVQDAVISPPMQSAYRPTAPAPDIDSGPVDLDLDLASEALNNVYASNAAVAPVAPAPLQPPPAAVAAPATQSGGDIDFNFDMDTPPASEVAYTPPPARPMEFDLNEISLDLDSGTTTPGALAQNDPPVDLNMDDDGRDPLVRKFELAEEFRQIGDVEGARDLLQEVVSRADGTLKTKAQALLKALA
ncbi:MAG: FimV/HubP family polar landmark protein [Pseudomonadota bacterium]